MNFKNLRTDDSAVSPVIGVILMVAITVILAAVIGTFVLNLGNQVQTSAPSASFSFDEVGEDEYNVTHDGGDSIAKSNINVTVGGDAENAIGEGDWNDKNPDGDVTAGSSVTVDATGGETIRVIWQSDNGGNSQILAEYTA